MAAAAAGRPAVKGLALIVVPPTADGPPWATYRVEEFDGDGDALRRAVLGGWLEPAPSHESVTVWCNEEGKALGLPVNRLAMDVWIRWDVYHCLTVGRDWLAGNVVVTGGAGPDGETLDLPEAARRWILRVPPGRGRGHAPPGLGAVRSGGRMSAAQVWTAWAALPEDHPAPVKADRRLPGHVHGGRGPDRVPAGPRVRGVGGRPGAGLRRRRTRPPDTLRSLGRFRSAEREAAPGIAPRGRFRPMIAHVDAPSALRRLAAPPPDPPSSSPPGHPRPVTDHPVTQAPVDTLRPHPRNYRTHPEDQLAHIVRSLQLHGFYRNVVVARDGTILAGHGVVLAARQLGLETVPVIRLDVAPDDARALQVLTGDNEIANLGDVDDRELTELLRELATEDWDLLLGTGF